MRQLFIFHVLFVLYSYVFIYLFAEVEVLFVYKHIINTLSLG